MSGFGKELKGMVAVKYLGLLGVLMSMREWGSDE